MSPNLTRLLLPTRFAVLSLRAAEYVRMLARKFEVQIHVVHVVPFADPLIDPGMGPVAIPPVGPDSKELLVEARRRLTDFVKEVLPDLAGRTNTFAIIGAVANELVSYAAEHQIDLIVMGTHADSMLKRLVFGSIGKSVLEAAPCPVLLVPVRDAPRKSG